MIIAAVWASWMKVFVRKYKIIFHQDNALAYKSVLGITKFNELKYELLEYPLYSPDLTSSDYYLFINLKQLLRGKRFPSNEEAIAGVDGYFAEIRKVIIAMIIIKLLGDHKIKCFVVKGGYIG